jgi:methionine biosynthesis protein MetW
LDEFPNYDAYWLIRARDGKHASKLDRYVTVAKSLPTAAKVLDIGSGDGAFLKYLKDNRPDCILTGADVSKVAIESLARLNIDGIHLDQHLPLAEQLTRKGHWDAVILMEVIEHVADAEDLIRQVIALAPKCIFITIPNVGFVTHRLRLMLGGRFPVTSIFYHMREHVRFWTVKDFAQWAPSMGLTLVSMQAGLIDPKSPVAWLIRLWPSLFAKQMVYELRLGVRS